jgi:glycosyltransferase involved in cell wall biosynthesis
MTYRLVEIELTQPLATIALDAEEKGCGIVARWQDRPVGFHMVERAGGETISTEELRVISDREFAPVVLAARIEASLAPPLPPPGKPVLSIAICTRNRAPRLARLLRSLEGLGPEPAFAEVEIIVVDNGSTDHTEATVRGRDRVRYVHERRAGLDFARNAALREAKGDLLAYLDDDVVVDRGWLKGLASAWSSTPDAGGFTGLVLPYRLDTQAQWLFERRGGFRRGFRRIEFRRENHDSPLFPVGAGSVGAGCNMAFDRRLLLEIGGFDEALDTGAPLPGGGDLDIFYRVLRSGRAMVYEPSFAVHHEHRETMAELERQYWSWGLGHMAFLSKSRRSDPELRQRHGAMIRWWFVHQLKTCLQGARSGDLVRSRFALAELRGGLQGLAGEYGRSQKRVADIKARLA